MNNRKKVNTIIIINDYMQKHRILIVLIMLGIILGLFMGRFAVTSGIQKGYWKQEGYYYEKPVSQNFITNYTLIYGHYNLSTFKYPDYSTHAYFTVTPQTDQQQIIIFECKNSTLIITNNKLMCKI